jgi:hypothetical protein
MIFRGSHWRSVYASGGLFKERFAGFGLTVFSLWAALSIPALADCPLLEPETGFFDTQGNHVDPVLVDYIALVETATSVTVYRRTQSDAVALVGLFAASGESDPDLLDASTWMVANSIACEGDLGPGKKCTGACPGKQRCKRIHKPAKDICACVY